MSRSELSTFRRCRSIFWKAFAAFRVPVANEFLPCSVGDLFDGRTPWPCRGSEVARGELEDSTDSPVLLPIRFAGGVGCSAVTDV